MTTSFSAQVGFRGRGDTVGLNVNTWDHAQNSNWSQIVDVTFRLRLEVEEQNGKNETVQGTIEYDRNSSGTWTQVTTTSNVVRAVASSQFADADPTTNLLTGSAKTFIAGEGSEDATPSNYGLNNTHTEIEYALQIRGIDVNGGDTIRIRLTGLDAYTVTPTITAVEPIIQTVNQASETETAQPITAVGGAAPAFPQVQATATSFQSTTTSSHTVSLPAGITAGELLLAIFTLDGAPAPLVGWPAGWTEIREVSDGLSATTLSIAYRIADGTEGPSITVSSVTNDQSAHIVYRISDHDASTNPPEVSTGASGDGQLVNPDSLTVSGGVDDYLWIACLAADGSGTTGPWDVTAAPANYTNLVSRTSGGSISGVTAGAARRELNAATDDPGAFTVGDSGGKEWVAVTIAVYPGAPAGLTGTVNQASETDAAQAINGSKVKAIGQATETETAQAITLAVPVVQAVNQATETDAVQPATAGKARAIGQAVESEITQAATSAKVTALGQSIEVETAQPAGKGKARVTGQSAETDAAQAVAISTATAIGQPAETDVAQAIEAHKIRAIAQATEADAAQPAGASRTYLATGATESEIAQPLAKQKTAAVGQVVETDAAQGVSPLGEQIITVAQVVETDAAQPASVNPQRRLMAQAGETEAAQAAGSLKTAILSTAAEPDLAQPVATAKTAGVAQGAEGETALAIDPGKSVALGRATEVAQAWPAGSGKAQTLGQGVESDLAQPVAQTGQLIISVSQTFETNSAQATAINPQRRLAGQTAESEAAGAMTAIKTVVVGLAAETESVPALAIGKTVAVGLVVEDDAAQSLAYLGQKVVAVAPAVEGETAQGFQGHKTATVNVVLEGEAVGSVTATRVYSLGEAAETDTAIGVTWAPKVRVVAQAAEAETALAMLVAKGEVGIYTVALQANLSPAVALYANPTPAVGLKNNPTPSIEVEVG